MKAKCIHQQELVIGGFTPPSNGSRGIGSLLLGEYQDGKLVYMGRVGTGYSGEVAADLLHKLKPLKRATSPFSNTPPRLSDVNWVEPRPASE